MLCKFIKIIFVVFFSCIIFKGYTYIIFMNENHIHWYETVLGNKQLKMNYVMFYN